MNIFSPSDGSDSYGPSLAQILLSYQTINYLHPLISYICGLRLLFLSSNASYPLPSRLLLLNKWDYFRGGHARFVYTAKPAPGVGVKTTIKTVKFSFTPLDLVPGRLQLVWERKFIR